MQALQSRRIELKLGHADNEIVHADLAAVVESAREGDFAVKSLGENGLFNAFNDFFTHCNNKPLFILFL
ncbi:hypothetical protein [uncultured Megasphaera sp.]|uniref:hypothetical protein n=1 Tax=uncultured Megasphaera sp. TaxID=165188 RepID=UPI0025CC7B0A|nr:hypothetical protein [uncultured Megasphaera sp.]